MFLCEPPPGSIETGRAPTPCSLSLSLVTTHGLEASSIKGAGKRRGVQLANRGFFLTHELRPAVEAVVLFLLACRVILLLYSYFGCQFLHTVSVASGRQ
jgi:hypothetical protein